MNFKKSDRNIWTPYANWHTLLTVTLFEMSSWSFAKGQWQWCHFINGLLIYPSFNTELNQPTGQTLMHNHHSDSPPHTLPTFYLWYLLGWITSSLPGGACAAPLSEGGNAEEGSSHGLQAALVMIATEDKTPLVKWHSAAGQTHSPQAPSVRQQSTIHVRCPPSACVSPFPNFTLAISFLQSHHNPWLLLSSSETKAI